MKMKRESFFELVGPFCHLSRNLVRLTQNIEYYIYVMQYMALSENRAPKNSCGPSSFPPQMVVLCSIKRPAGTEKVEFSKQLTTHYQKRIHQKKHNRRL